MLIYLLRHGETDYNREKRYQGITDIPLSETGKEKLVRADIAPDLVYVSPMIRARETAAILFPQAQQIEIEGLREMNFGAFEGRSFLEMEQDADYRGWVEGGCEGCCPGGDEDKAAFCARVYAAFSSLVDGALRDGQETLVIVAHGGTQMAVMERYALPRRSFYEWHAGNGAGFILDTVVWETEHTLRLVRQAAYTKENP